MSLSPGHPKVNVVPVQGLPIGTPGIAAAIERKAGKISDPIQRLQYLRQATTTPGDHAFNRRFQHLASILLLAAVVPLCSDARIRRQPDTLPRLPAVRTASFDVPNVWVVETSRDFETYSNGLRIEDRLAVANKPRSFPLISRAGGQYGPRRSQPAGIVFHTTESDQAPFEATQKQRLQRIGQELLQFVRGRRAYHFVIDRFGRVHRIVVESDDANHAGNSVWADSEWTYLDLNSSFLGVAFEASMATDQPPINQAQVHAARVLTEMLRSKYNLAAENCITHAQVSVNPDNMHVGWHADWGKDFPFREIGLPQNYELPLPSLFLFGFDYDPIYQSATGPELWRGLALAEEQLRQAAQKRHMAVAEYKGLLQREYRDRIAALRHRSADQENSDESK
jgi:hypothetical protein